jgi:hypothetical protein
MSISSAAARDDLYELIELVLPNKGNPAKLAQIVDALEDSIPRLDPVRFRGEFEHVVKGPDLPELETVKEMARAALEGRLVPPPASSEENSAPDGGTQRSLSGAARLLWGRPRRPRA